MNFFGHLAVATWYSQDAAHHLGAMLPDLATMLGTTAPTAEGGSIAAGIELHHRTDAVFHGCEHFRELNSQAFATLERQGVPRGAARAVAHIGTEILLDGVLAEHSATRTAFQAALEHGTTRERELGLDWRRPPPEGRLAQLCRVIAERDILKDSQLPERVAYRLDRILGHRPRLRIPASHLPLVEAWAEQAREEVRARADGLLTQIAQGLAEVQ
ncbi:MAG: hypothetical protein H6718_05925 [Polyangiaceae bacterium]|nr:hypothetical protein [Myxococcales bacterium]MCB9584914.1 hypothetical protein [Polyangiaceae bacterium]MCB9607513.1 hypothetical protein [Polyangiaceae bacterium]